MKRFNYILLTIAILGGVATQATAQTQDTTFVRTVVVEQEYTPDIMDATKINTLPKVEAPTSCKKQVVYDEVLSPAQHIPTSAMDAFVGNETQTKALPGFARLGYGSTGNLDAYANYLLTLSPKDKLSATLNAYGFNGDIDFLKENNMTWDTYFYQGALNVDYLHNFRKMDFNTSVNIGLSKFKLFPNQNFPDKEKQQFLSWDVHVGIASTDKSLPLQFKAETNFLSFTRENDFLYQKGKENIIHTRAEAFGNMSDSQAIGLVLSMDNTFYNNLNAVKSQNEQEETYGFKNHTNITATPYFAYKGSKLNIHAGIDVDLALNYGKTLQLAPDVKVSYNFANHYQLYAEATGGRIVNDFRRLGKINPYLQFCHPEAGSNQVLDTYETLNANLGIKASLIEGLWLHLYGEYQMLQNDLLSAFVEDEQGEIAYYSYPIQQDTRNFRFGMDASYNYKDIFSIAASFSKYAWSTSASTAETESNQATALSLAFKPSIMASAEIGIRPISQLQIKVGYQHIDRKAIADVTQSPISNLHIYASYELHKQIAIYAQVHNLLNKSYQLDWGVYDQGFSLLGGVLFRF